MSIQLIIIVRSFPEHAFSLSPTTCTCNCLYRSYMCIVNKCYIARYSSKTSDECTYVEMYVEDLLTLFTW